MENSSDSLLAPEMNSYGAEVALSNKFPGKLWRMVNSCQSGAISWGQGGRTIIIHQTKFQDEFLQEGNGLFKTANIGSFIRQLNLYGFRKLNVLRYAESGSELREIHEFQSDFFVQGRPELLSRLRRNVGIRRSREANDVKRQLEEIHGYANKKNFLELQNSNYISIPTSYPLAHYQRLTVPNSVQSGGQTNAQWPVFMQWDGRGGYKYLVHPEANQEKASPKPQLQSLLQPTVRTKRAPEGETFQVLHIPESGGGEPAKEYYLLSLMTDETAASQSMPQQPQQQQQQQHQPQQANYSLQNVAGHARGSGSAPLHHEYSQAELYQLADMLASNPQCAIAAAQQLLAQATQQDQALMSEKGDVGSDCWLSPPSSPTGRASPSSILSDVKLDSDVPHADIPSHLGLISDVKLEPSEESPMVVMSINDMSPRVIVTSNEETCKSPTFHSYLQYTDNLEQAFLPPREEEDSLDSVEDPANRSLNLVLN